MKEEAIYIVGQYPQFKPRKGTPTHLTQARAFGYLKQDNKNVPVIDIHETSQGIQIEVEGY